MIASTCMNNVSAYLWITFAIVPIRQDERQKEKKKTDIGMEQAPNTLEFEV